MNPDNTPLGLINTLRLPVQEQTNLGFCDSNRASKVAAWANLLPATRITHTSVLLYQALPEVSRLQTTPSNRFEILEHLRPYVQQCIEGLAQSFLDQPLILPEGAMKTAVIAQALQKHMSNGYGQVAQDLIRKRPEGHFKGEELKLITAALHRAMTGLGLQFLRNAQIYTETSSRLWQELKTLYQVARQLDLLKASYRDPMLKQLQANSIEQSFFRTLLLACASPNQLRQQEVNRVYDALEDWSKIVRLTPLNANSNNLFYLDFDNAQPPQQKTQAGDPQSPTHDALEIDLYPLLEALRTQAGPASTQDIIKVPPNISQHLMTHLIQAWGQERQRGQPRKPSRGILEVAVGLTNAHFYVAHHLPFEQFLAQAGNRSNINSHFSSTGLSGSDDPWANAFDVEKGHRSPQELGIGGAGNSRRGEQKAKSDKYPLHQVQMSDLSPRGYCLDWRQSIPAQAKAGELIALREPRRHQWNLGVIRWVKQHKGTSQLGIEIIAQNAQAVAAKQLQKTGADNVFMRAFASTKAGEGYANDALITATHPFREQNKVDINLEEQSLTVQLSKLLYGTSSMNLFSYRQIDSVTSSGGHSPANTQANTQDDEFSSDW